MIVKTKHKIYTISHKIGNKVGIDLPFFIENGFWTFTNQLVNLVIGFGLYIIFANYLTKEIFGQYNLVLSFIGMFAFLSLPGLNVAIAHSVANGMQKTYIKAVKLSIKWSLLGSLSLLIVAIWYLYNSDYELTISISLAALFYPIMQAFSRWQAFFIGLAAFDKIAKYTIIQNIISFLVYGIVVYFFPHTVLYIIAAYIILTSVFNLLWHSKVKMQVNDTPVDADCIPYGKFMTKASLLNMLILHFDKIIVGFLNIETLAVYAISLKLIDSFKTLIKSVLAISFPKFVNQNVSLKTKHIILLMLIGLLISLVLFSISKYIIVLFFGVKYAESVELFNKLVFIMPIFFVSTLLNIRINAEKKKNKIILINTIVPISTLFISVLTFIITKNLEYFVIAKVYTTQIAYFFILVPKYDKLFNFK